jgi:hypothetical protein
MVLKVPIILMVRPRGIEPPHPAPEAGALSTELRAHTALMIISLFRTSGQRKLAHLPRLIIGKGEKRGQSLHEGLAIYCQRGENVYAI